MRKWYVAPDGTPKAFVKGTRQDLAARGFVVVTNPIPPGMHEEKNGKFAKWNFVTTTWETDTAREAQWINDQNSRNQVRDDAKAAFQFLKNNKDSPTLTTNQVANSLIDILTHIAPRL